MSNLRRLTAFVVALPLLLLSLQGSAASCMAGGAAAPQAATAAAAPMAGMASMHHAMPSDDAAPPTTPPPDDHGSGCPDRHPIGSCASMPTCASVAAMPATGATLALAPVHHGIASGSLDAPPAPRLAPELPPPRA